MRWRLALLIAAIATSFSCRGPSYITVIVTSEKAVTLQGLDATVTNAGASSTIHVATTPFTVPPAATFALKLAPDRSGDVTVTVHALGPVGEFATATGTTSASGGELLLTLGAVPDCLIRCCDDHLVGPFRVDAGTACLFDALDCIVGKHGGPQVIQSFGGTLWPPDGGIPFGDAGIFSATCPTEHACGVTCNDGTELPTALQYDPAQCCFYGGLSTACQSHMGIAKVTYDGRHVCL